MVQMYYGNGKGKTSAAIGAALRAAGSGMRVLVTQFFKDGSSGEIVALEKIENIEVAFPQSKYKLFTELTPSVKEKLKTDYTAFFHSIFNMQEDYDMIVLDEVLDAYALDAVDRTLFLKFLRYCPLSIELIITGHKCPDEIIRIADYVTEFVSVKHPYDSGTKARRGIEY